MYDFTVFIGRFQPVHVGHIDVIRQAMDKSARVILCVGSANEERTYRNPFSYHARKLMIKQSVKEELGESFVDRLVFVPINDILYNDEKWIEQVQHKVKTAVLDNYPGNAPSVTLHGLSNIKVALIGFNKDNTSYYLKMFPQWDSIEAKQNYKLSSTVIRGHCFLHNIDPHRLNFDMPRLPFCVATYLKDFMSTEAGYELKKEYEFVDSYKKAWEVAPYPPTFVTVDAVVIQSGHILLVKRGHFPGKGSLALPGGFLNNQETLLDGAIRELREETRLKVPVPALRGSVVAKETFDDPHRSSRGRTLTTAFLIHLTPRPEENFKLPKVKGSDDADEAAWYPLSDLENMKLFEDHYHIIQKMLGEL